MANFLSRFLGKSKAGNDRAVTTGIDRRVKEERHSGPAELPPGLAVCRKFEDIPRLDQIVSGAEKGALVRLGEADAKRFIVGKKGNEYTILVSTEAYGTPQSRRVFEEIREALSGVDVGRERTMWATPEMLDGVRISKASNAVVNDTLATTTSKHALEFTEWLEYGMKNRASDMHVERVGDVATVRFRVDGALERMRNGADGQVVGDLAKRVLASVYDKLVDDGSNTSSSFNEKAYFSSTVTYELPNKRLQLRCQVNPSADGFDFISRFRLVRDNATVMSYREMGYTPSQITQIEEALKGRRGLIIIAGIPNSGKTTLVEAMLTHFPNKEKYKFVTLDDPVEFKVPGVTHATIKNIPGNPEESEKFYTQAMESWLRGNPDVISLGEIRNRASGRSAITTARVGCLGIATIHANSQMGIYERLTDPEIGLAIRAITSDEIVALGGYQSLVPLVCKECALSTEQMPLPMQSKVKMIADKFKVDTSNLRFSHGHIGDEPCPVCNGRGTFGMKVVAEMYSPTEEFLKSLRSGDDFGARDIWLAESDGRFDSDDMTGKPVFLHAFKDALDGRIDLRSCERFGSFEKYKVVSTEPKNLKVRSA